jgi:hypothetical protein
MPKTEGKPSLRKGLVAGSGRVPTRVAAGNGDGRGAVKGSGKAPKAPKR